MQCREQLIEVYLDWKNNYLTPDAFAADNGLTVVQALTLISLAREVANTPHPEQ